MKKFLVIGNINAVSYKEIFPLIKDNKMWTGQNAKEGTRKGNSLSFYVDDDELKQVAAWWYTNLDCTSHNEFIDLYKHYSPDEYPKYDNYDAIEVSKVCNIPIDYDGVISVPISFLDKYCKDQFEIIGCAFNGSNNQFDYFKPIINGKNIYKRILIKRR